MALSNPKPWTYELYSLLPEDGKRHEIIDGEHYVTPAPRTRHQKIVAEILFALKAVADTRDLGTVLTAPCDLYFTETDNVQPDVFFISNERRAIIKELRVEGAPDLVVEILSPSTRRRDEVLKRDLYERFEVPEYWIVDPELETVKIFRLSDEGGFDEPKTIARERGESLETPLLPGLTLSLETLFLSD